MTCSRPGYIAQGGPGEDLIGDSTLSSIFDVVAPRAYGNELCLSLLKLGTAHGFAPAPGPRGGRETVDVVQVVVLCDSRTAAGRAE